MPLLPNKLLQRVITGAYGQLLRDKGGRAALDTLMALHEASLPRVAELDEKQRRKVAGRLFGRTIGEVMADPYGWHISQVCAGEAYAVARAKGIALKAGLEEGVLKAIERLPAEMKPSMLHDLEAGRRLELDVRLVSFDFDDRLARRDRLAFLFQPGAEFRGRDGVGELRKPEFGRHGHTPRTMSPTVNRAAAFRIASASIP